MFNVMTVITGSTDVCILTTMDFNKKVSVNRVIEV